MILSFYLEFNFLMFNGENNSDEAIETRNKQSTFHTGFLLKGNAGLWPLRSAKREDLFSVSSLTSLWMGSFSFLGSLS
jgi:hypothetical protein